MAELTYIQTSGATFGLARVSDGTSITTGGTSSGGIFCGAIWDNGNNLYIAEKSTGAVVNIRKFTSAGTSVWNLLAFATCGGVSANFEGIRGLAYKDGILYVDLHKKSGASAEREIWRIDAVAGTVLAADSGAAWLTGTDGIKVQASTGWAFNDGTNEWFSGTTLAIAGDFLAALGATTGSPSSWFQVIDITDGTINSYGGFDESMSRVDVCTDGTDFYYCNSTDTSTGRVRKVTSGGTVSWTKTSTSNEVSSICYDPVNDKIGVCGKNNLFSTNDCVVTLDPSDGAVVLSEDPNSETTFNCIRADNEGGFILYSHSTDTAAVHRVDETLTVDWGPVTLGPTGQHAHAVSAATRELSNTIIFAHSVGLNYNLAKSASNTISFSHSNDVFNSTVTASQTISFAHSATVIKDYSRSVSDIFGVFHTHGVSRLSLASNTITFSDEAIASKSIGILQSLTFGQTLVNEYDPHNESILQSLGVTHSVTNPIVRSLSVSNTITFVGATIGLRVRFLTVAQTFAITNNAANVKLFNPSNTIVFSQSATNSHIIGRSLTSVLAPTQTLTRTVVYVRSLTDTLTFLTIHIKNGIDVPTLQYTIPKRYLKLIYQSRTILLPRPELGDSEGLRNQLSIKRTTTGGTYTYVKRIKNRKLKYEIHMNRNKAYELRSYIDLTAGKKITLENWKGEIWVGYVITNPIEFTTETRSNTCGERLITTIEFDGVRIH